MTENQRKKIVKVEQLETFAEIADTLYGSPMGASGENHAPGQVPDPGATAGTSRFLREDGTWQKPSVQDLCTPDSTDHDYVEIAGIRWATMNVGANSITDYGLYFQWGDTQGYTSGQCGTDEGQKYFGWADYKYGNGTSSQSASDMTKYNSTDGKTVLDASDDAVAAAWGGSWRMPTTAEYAALGAAVNSAWTADYQGSGVSGLVLTDKTDSSKVLFFPAAGFCFRGGVNFVGRFGYCWSSSVNGGELQRAYGLYFDSGAVNWQYYDSRFRGYTVRGVLDDSNILHKVAVTGNYNDLENKPSSMPASDVSAWAKAANKPSYTLDEVSDGSTRKLADKIGKTIETTWTNLKSLRDNSQLVPGQFYRITDYVTTTVQTDTQSAGHAFDVIVTADDESTLNENARAIIHSGDTYFTTAGAKLKAWELKYSLENDTTKFAWADSTNGKGVIYYMKDERDNECPYDFKNIQFKVGAKSQAGTVADVFYYTFSVASGTNDVTVTDHSLNGFYCYGNRIKKYISNAKQELNFNVFRNTSTTSNCNSNTFGDDNYSNTFGNKCYNNTFGNSCNSNTFGNSFQYNSFGNGNYDNSFGKGCNSNAFGNYCGSNSLGNNCSDTSFGNYFQYNSLGNNCSENSFGNYFQHNSFGNGCGRNTFGNYCRCNTFGVYSYFNSFGNGCQYITFSKDYCSYNIVENGNQYITLTSTQTTSGSNRLRNIKICQGVNNTTAIKTISHDTVNDTFQTEYKPTNSQVISV